LVSDEEDEQEFEDNINSLYVMINSAISREASGSESGKKNLDTLRTKIKIEQKCNILLTIDPQVQTSIQNKVTS
jgi:hypothetical protein